MAGIPERDDIPMDHNAMAIAVSALPNVDVFMRGLTNTFGAASFASVLAGLIGANVPAFSQYFKHTYYHCRSSSYFFRQAMNFKSSTCFYLL